MVAVTFDDAGAKYNFGFLIPWPVIIFILCITYVIGRDETNKKDMAECWWG